MSSTWTINQSTNASSGYDQNEKCSYKPQWNEMSKQAYRGLSFKEFKNEHSFLAGMRWGSRENTIGPKQIRVSGWQRGWGSQWVGDRFRACLRATCVPFPTSVKPSQKGCRDTMIGWEGNAPNCFQSSICDLNLFWKSAQNKRKTASLKQWVCHMCISIFHYIILPIHFILEANVV